MAAILARVDEPGPGIRVLVSDDLPERSIHCLTRRVLDRRLVDDGTIDPQ